jgi:hypothetical protein
MIPKLALSVEKQWPLDEADPKVVALRVRNVDADQYCF